MTDLYRPDVVAGKYDASLFDPTGETLLVNEIFYSLQGEGYHTGQATVFIRLAKCNLACKFCDTEFETYQRMSVQEIVEKVHALAPEPCLVDLTGGEPLLQNFGPLVEKLAGYWVGVETSGSVQVPPDLMEKLDWVTCSPKVPKARLASIPMDEVKWIVNAPFLAQFEKDPDQFYVEAARNYLQPESNNPKWITAASKLVMRFPSRYTLSLQTHKLAGNP